MIRRVLGTLALLTLLLAFLTAITGCSSICLQSGSDTGNTTRAALIDQLFPSNPDQYFIDRITALLQKNGYMVDYFSGDQITVDLYRHLAARNYNLVVFRAHAGLLGNGTRADQKTCLFTNQPYRQTGEYFDQIQDRVVKAGVNNQPPLFGINAEFVLRSMQGKFNQTTVIMMGCNTLKKDDLARAFIEKGASAYAGWDSEVDLSYDQRVMLRLLDSLFKDSSLPTAVQTTMSDKGPDPDSGAELKYCCE